MKFHRGRYTCVSSEVIGEMLGIAHHSQVIDAINVWIEQGGDPKLIAEMDPANYSYRHVKKYRGKLPVWVPFKVIEDDRFYHRRLFGGRREAFLKELHAARATEQVVPDTAELDAEAPPALQPEPEIIPPTVEAAAPEPGPEVSQPPADIETEQTIEAEAAPRAVVTPESVPFYGDKVLAARVDGKIVVFVEPICNNLGVAYSSQLQRIKRNRTLREGMFKINIPTAGGPQPRAGIALDLVPGFIFGIKDSLVRPEVREKLIAYQRECYGALAKHFLGDHERALPPPQTDEEVVEQAFRIMHRRAIQAETEIKDVWRPKVAGLEFEKAKEQQARLNAEELAAREAQRVKELQPKADFVDEIVADPGSHYRLVDVASTLSVKINILADTLENKPPGGVYWAHRPGGPGTELVCRRSEPSYGRYIVSKSRRWRDPGEETGWKQGESIRITEAGLAYLHNWFKSNFKLVS